MNERIKELIKQAGIDDQTFPFDDLWYQPELTKFAKLIVRECTDIAKHHVMNTSTYSDAEFVGERIKEHFGVEE